MATANILDSTISKLKKRNEPKPQPVLPDPIIKQGKVVDLLWGKVVDFFADITSVVLKNNYDVTVKNFPKTQKVEITNAKDLIPPEVDHSTGIVTSLKALQQTIIDKPTYNAPEVQKVNVINQVTPEKIEFPSVQKVEVTNHPKTEKMTFPDKMKVEMLNTRDITMAIDSLGNKMVGGTKKEEPLNLKKEIEPIMAKMAGEIVTAIEQNKVTSVDVSNTGSFPVTFPIPTFKDVNGQTTQAKLDGDGNVPVVMGSCTDGSQITKIQETEPTDTTHLNPSLAIIEAVVGTVTTKTIVKTIGTDTYTKIISTDSSDNSVTVSSWS